ncbi:MAG: hypothetical protein IPP14_02685 [Planctomycetes bacterium]|nr:hypothetical protein [Planctomycetota bacterium]
MKRRLICSLAVLACCAIVARGAEAPPEIPPYEWKCEGDTAEAFKAEIVVKQKVDQSTARGVVEAYCGFADTRDLTRKADMTARAAWAKALAKSMSDWETLLLCESLRLSTIKARADDAANDGMAERSMHPTTVTGETAGEAGAVVIETMQKIIQKRTDKEGSVHEESYDKKCRFTCAKGTDGQWRITKAETAQRDWSQEKEVYAWREDTGMLGFFYFATKGKAPAAAQDPKQDTPQNAALSVYHSLLARGEVLNHKLYTTAFPSWVKACEALFEAGYLERIQKDVDDSLARADGRPVGKVEIESTTEGQEGRKVVLFKPVSEWSPPVQMTLKQTDGKWQVEAAGIVQTPKDGDNPADIHAVVDVYKLPKP